MTSATTPVPAQREPELAGQTVVVIGGSAGIGLETARRARAEGADVILTGRNPDRLKQAALDVGAQRTAAFDATDPAALERFFQDLPEPIDHVMVTGRGPHYAPLVDLDREVRTAISMRISGWPSPSRARRRQGAARRHAAVHGRHRRPPSGYRPRDRLGGHRRAARPDRQPRARARAGPRQPDRRRLRRHARCRRRCSAMTSRRAATSCARRSRSAAWSGRPTSPRSPSTS